MQRQRRQHARAELVQRLIQAVAVLAEARHFARPQVRRHQVAILGIVANLAADMPELLQVEMPGILGGFHAERGIAPRAAAAGHVVLALDLLGQREERLEHIVGRIDLRLRDAVVADAGEAPLAVGRAQFRDEGVAMRVETGDVQGRDVRSHGGNHRRERKKRRDQISRRYSR